MVSIISYTGIKCSEMYWFALAEINNLRTKLKTADEYAQLQRDTTAAEESTAIPVNDWVHVEGDWV